MHKSKHLGSLWCIFVSKGGLVSFFVIDFQNVISGHLKQRPPPQKKVTTPRPSSFQVYMKTCSWYHVTFHFPFLRDGAGPNLEKAQLQTSQSLLIQALMWFPRKSRYQCSPETVVSSSKTKVNCVYTYKNIKWQVYSLYVVYSVKKYMPT